MVLDAATDQSPTLGKYRLLAELGRGGMAQVYLAVASGPRGFHKLLVVKQIDAELAQYPDFVSMFLDEARLAAQLNHPNVVQTYEVGQEGNRYFIAMEYLEGQPLSLVLAGLTGKNRVLTLEMQLRVMIEALNGLHYAHELCGFDGKPLDLVHRDISPHNVFVTYSGQVKVVDFGIAKACTSSVRTATGMMKGKVGYMGPEQTRAEPVDPRADIYSVGVMLWEIAAGRRIFAGLSDFLVTQRVLNDDIPVPSSVCTSVSPKLEEIILRAMAPKREQRHASAAELASELEQFLRERGDSSTTKQVGRLIAEHFAEQRARIQAIIEAELSADAPASVAALPRLPVAGASETGPSGAAPESDGAHRSGEFEAPEPSVDLGERPTSRNEANETEPPPAALDAAPPSDVPGSLPATAPLPMGAPGAATKPVDPPLSADPDTLAAPSIWSPDGVPVGKVLLMIAVSLGILGVIVAAYFMTGASDDRAPAAPQPSSAASSDLDVPPTR